MADNTTTATTYTSNIPDYAKNYVTTMLDAAQKQMFTTDQNGQVTGFQPFIPYGATYDPQTGKVTNSVQDQANAAVAGFQPMQTSAFRDLANYTLPGQTEGASQTLNTITGQNLQNKNFTDQGIAQSYMNPYLQQALNPQLALLQQQQAAQGNDMAAQAARAGAFGNSRYGVQSAMQNQANQLGLQNLTGNAYNQAFNQAQSQFNADQARRLQGLSQAAASAQAMGQLGQQQYQQEMGLTNAQMAAGAQQQALEQQKINQAMQNYASQQQNPMLQLGMLSNMLRGLPMQGVTTQTYAAQPNQYQSIAGILGGINSMNQATKAPGTKKGGLIKKMAVGGIAGGVTGGISSGLNPYQLNDMLKQLSDQQLTQKSQDQLAGPETQQAAMQEQARRADIRNSAMAMATQNQGDSNQNPNITQAAKGGIMGYAKGGKTPDPLTTMPDYQAEMQKATQPAIDTLNQPIPEEAALKQSAQQVQAVANQTPEAAAQEQEAYKKAFGITTNPYEEGRKMNQDRTKKLEDRKIYDQHMAEARAWFDFGQTSGPVLKAANMALGHMVEKMELNKKEQDEILKGIQEANHELDKAEYLEKKGDAADAKRTKEGAIGKMVDINKTLYDNKAKIVMDKAKILSEGGEKAVTATQQERHAQLNYRAQMAQVSATLGRDASKQEFEKYLALKEKDPQKAEDYIESLRTFKSAQAGSKTENALAGLRDKAIDNVDKRAQNDFMLQKKYRDDPDARERDIKREMEAIQPGLSGKGKEVAPATETPPAGAPADVRKAPDGHWYSKDPQTGKYLKWS